VSNRAKIVIFYRSGQKMTLECDSFEVIKRGSEIVEVTWVNPLPRPLHLGVDDIVAVWES